LEVVVKGHDASPRERIRARILLLSHRGWDRSKIAEATGSSVSTVGRVRRSFCEEGLQEALSEKPRSGGPRKLTESEEQAVVALACSDPPAGFARWSVRLLTEEVHIRRMVTTAVSRERIRVVLHEHGLKPWREKNVVRSRAE
jgi:transposase